MVSIEYALTLPRGDIIGPYAMQSRRGHGDAVASQHISLSEGIDVERCRPRPHIPASIVAVRHRCVSFSRDECRRTRRPQRDCSAMPNDGRETHRSILHAKRTGRHGVLPPEGNACRQTLRDTLGIDGWRASLSSHGRRQVGGATRWRDGRRRGTPHAMQGIGLPARFQ
jgi:hypothetical protein